ncbi:hypothetical protein MFFC18_49730 [Mariniblastus fucicola]|uniref:Uncharacterized protein n=1 Tax=Mariniblastus fucicola TaxID=980251 RepID=A0A5B9PII4_9BACT|nr:hypothetical protein MFFC18_49730 [Mariniblastus fucicola]
MKITNQETGAMSNFLLMLGIVGAWIALQAFILPRFGIET